MFLFCCVEFISAARLCVSPTLDVPGNAGVAGIVDSEALIVIEVTVVTSDCPTNQGEELRIANILFNNLDIIGEYIIYLYICSVLAHKRLLKDVWSYWK